MSGSNKLAVFREFPFLSQCCDVTRLNDACVKRFDKEVLSLPLHCYCSGLRCSHYHEICLLGSEGNLLIRIGDFYSGCEIPFSFFKPWSWGSPFISDLSRCTASDAFQILKSGVKHVHYAIDIHEGELTLYK